MKSAVHYDETCVFNSEKHTYTLSDGVILPSVTTYSKKYFKEFDSDKIATAYALKNNLMKEDVLALWKAKGEKATTFGTACHKYAEDLITAFQEKQSVREPENNHEKGIKEKVTELCNCYDVVGQELILFSRQLNLAGTADLLLAQGKTLYITDWKTNQEIKTQNKYQNGLGCLYTYPDCEKTKYTVQLNLYLKIIIAEKYFPQYNKYELMLFHVKESGVAEIKLPVFPSYIFTKL